VGEVVVSLPRQGELWWGEHPHEKGRPYLVLSRNEAIEVLHAILVVPVTRTIRSIPTELLVGVEEGLPVESAAAFDNLRAFPRAYLTRRVGALDPSRRHELCSVLGATADC